MFDNFRATHPVTFWVIVVGLILIAVWVVSSYVFGGAANTQSTAGVQTLQGPTDAQVSAASALSVAQLQAQSDQQARQDNLTLQEETLGVQYKIAQLQSAQGTNQDTLNYNLGVAQLQAQTQQIGIAAQVQSQSNQLSAQTAQQQIAANEQTQLAATNASVSINNAGQKTAQKSSSNNLVGGIIGAGLSILGGLFSDARLKQNAMFHHQDPVTGLWWYSYEFTPQARKLLRLPTGRYVGVFAQDLLDTRFAHAVSRGAHGFLKVDYSKIIGSSETAIAAGGMTFYEFA